MPPIETEDDNVSTRDALEQAFDQAEETESEESVEHTEEETIDESDFDTEEEEGADEELDDEEDEDATAEGTDDSEEDEDDDASGDTRLSDDETDETDEGEGPGPDNDSDRGDTGRAPVSWSPKTREHWNKLPKEVKEQVHKREKEVAQALGESTRARRFTEAWEGLVQPYEPLMQAQGANAYSGVKRLLEVASTLSVGAPAAKATMIANLVKQYGVDIQSLDSALAGEDVGGDPGVQSAIQQALQPLQSQLNQYQQRDQQAAQATQQEVASEMQQFASKAEFFEDVRNDMADLLEVASRNGRSLTLQQAYDQATRMHPEISEIVQQREKAKSAKKNTRAARRKGKAASSVRGKPSGGNTEKTDDAPDVGSAVRDAWDKVATKRSRV